jgi:GWxTD domain-containing protein
MKNFQCIVLILFVAVGFTRGQALQDINFSYDYNLAESFSFRLKPVKEANQWLVFYKLSIRDTSMASNDFTIQWETRQTLSEKQNSGFQTAFAIKEQSRSKTHFYGTVTFDLQQTPKIIVAKVINNVSKRAWIFYRAIEENYPITMSAERHGEILFDGYGSVNDSIRISSPGSKIISFYNDDFPAALPPFSEAQGRVPKGIKPDSTYYVGENDRLQLSQRGLYLVQSDTNATQGLSFRVESDYPKFTKVTSLAGPLIYISTKQENDRLVLAKNDKKAFDRVILNITQDTDRARKLIRNYFRRVEIVNQLFTSYKEGWKTDRGMIYIIFGPPEQVLKFNDREVWTYKTSFDVTFNFAKASSIFDPDNYVLMRDKKYQQLWYEVIDLWRDARF